MIDDATSDLLTRQYTKTPELAECAVEMNLAWKLTGTEGLTLYYDSVDELGQLTCFKCLFFASSRSDFRIEYVPFTLLMMRTDEETQKAINRLKGFGSP